GVFEGIWIEDLPAPELVSFGRSELGGFRGLIPFRVDRVHLMVDDVLRLGLRQQIRVAGGGDAAGELAVAVPVSTYRHSLRCLATGAGLGADVVGRGEPEGVAVPEGRVISGVVIRVADADVEGDAGEQLAEGLPRVGETAPYHVSQVVVGGITSHHDVQAEDGQRGDDHPAVLAAFGSVEPLDKEDVVAEYLGHLRRG